MEIKKLLKKTREGIGKYKYVVLIFCVGLVFMLMPVRSQVQAKETQTSVEMGTVNVDFSTELEMVLSRIAGAGETKVMLTTYRGKETIYQTDENREIRDGNSDYSTRTVLVTDGERNETGLIRQINPPVYQGAIVICKGAENPTVRLSIVEAVSKVTGLGANQIAVLKMK